MNELDSAGRHHAQVVVASVADIAPPPMNSLVSKTSRRSRGSLLVAVVGLAIAVGGFAVLAIRDGGVPSATDSASPPTPSSATSSLPPPSTTLGPSALPAFNVSLFIDAKLGGAFNEPTDEIGVVALVPVDAQQAFEAYLATVALAELDSVTYISSSDVAAAAKAFATAQGTAPPEQRWVAVGFVPRFLDSPTGDWIEELAGVAGVRIARVDFVPLATRGLEGWQVVADLGFGISSGAIVQAVDAGVVVIDGISTRLVLDDGSWVDGAPSPLAVQSSCCGDVSGFPATDSVILIKAENSEVWILDVDTLTWRQADTPPATGYPVGSARYPLGSALIDRELVVVTAAGRYVDAISTVAALDIDTGAWREFDPVPSPIAVGGVTSDGNRLIVAGTAQDGNNVVIGDRNPVVYQHTTDSGWQELPSIPIDGQASTITWVDNAGILAWNYEQESAILDRSGQWRTIGNVPMPFSECYPRSESVNAGAVGQCGGLAWFDAATVAWHPIETPYVARFAWARDRLAGFLEVDRNTTRLTAYDLPPKSPSDS